MIPLTYTLTIGQESTLRHIEMLRVNILSVVMPLHVERYYYWKSLIETVQSGYRFAHEHVSENLIERAIESRKPLARDIEFSLYWQALQRIRTSWAGTQKYLEYEEYLSLFSDLRLHVTVKHTVSPLETAIAYINAGHEHPIIQMAIITAVLLHSDLPKKESALCASLSAYAILTTHGYTCRDLYSPLYGLTAERDSFTVAIQSITTDGNLNHWILYVLSSIERSLEDALQKIQSTPHTIGQKTRAYEHLTQRQKTILQILEKPGSTVQNSYIQRRFNVSQLTASRDLTHLTKIGLISPHGKSRSTTYSRIG